MKPSLALAANIDAIRLAVASHKMANPRVFGSVARGEDKEGSDLDLLVDIEGGDYFDLIALEEKLQALMGIRVDVVSARALHRVIRDDVLGEARPL